jgi:hypothetical protein
LATAAALAGGCGDGAADPEPKAIDALARYLPADIPGVILYADLALAREQLGLGRFATSLFGLSARNLKPKPVTEAFDGHAIKAAATSGTRAGPVTAIRTSQPFDAGSLGTGLYDCG